MTGSPLPYFGGKSFMAPWLISLMPPHMHYVEPFCGGLSVVLAKPASPMETLNDLDGDVITFWRVVRERPAELARLCAMTPHSRGEFERSQRLPYPDDLDDLERARLTWVGCAQARSNHRSGSGWRYGIETNARPHDPAEIERRIMAASRRLERVSLECLPANEIIERYGRSRETLLYVDPPYLGATRGSIHRYVKELATDDEHRELALGLRKAKGIVMLSGYASDLYDQELFPDWYRYTYPSRLDSQAFKNEVVWSNVELLSQPQLFEVHV